ncbi:MAG TPA: ELWxxDGT repeat protein [Thermoanaerobaculia bacterium]|nr:ELWxxDGT repeat protein [Thermoanaerobaculia bacterium]
MPTRFLPALILLSFLAGTQEAAGAGPASLVLDINATGFSGDNRVGVTGPFLPMGGKVLFPAFEASSGTEIWVSDGTPEGTRLVRDLCPGPCSSTFRLLGAAGNVGIFWVNGDGNFRDPVELWRTDGTAAGTFRLSSNADGGPGTDCFVVESTPAASLGGLLLLSLSSPEAGCELWRTDGTAAGTVLVKDILPGPDNSVPNQFAVAGGQLYFFTVDPGGAGLWRSDGTAAGTTFLHSFPVNTPRRNLTAAGSRVFFIADQFGEQRLWTSDGTAAGTKQLAAFAELKPRLFQEIGGIFYFLADDGGGIDLWRSDGTVAGTVEVTDFNQSNPFFDFKPSEIVKLGSRLVFVTDDGLSGPRLWTSGGTPATTVPFEGCPEGCPTIPDVFHHEGNPIVKIGNRAVFAGEDARGVELWITDGTGAGTRMIRDLCPDPEECSSYPHGLFGALGKAFFSGQNPGSFGHWATDGTAEGTVHIADAAPDASGGDLLKIPPVTVGGRVFYTAKDSPNGPQLWVSDGSPEGTRPAGAIHGSGPGSFPSELVRAGSEVRFVACDEETRAVWRSGGTAASTSALAVASVHCSFNDPLKDLTVADGLTFFLRKAPSENVYRLWRTDGTEAGTLQLSLTGGTETGAPIVFGGRVVFLVTALGAGSAALWESNGSPAGTRKLFDLPADILFPSDLTVLGPELYFVAQTGSLRYHQLWRSDGTKAGTRQVTNFETSFFFRRPLQLARAAGTVFFVASVRSLGDELWKTNGTLASTAMVLPPTFDAAGKDVSNLVTFQGEVYFTAHVSSADVRHGLWRSNGTAAGTKLVKAIGQEPEDPSYTELGGRLFFVAADEEHGLELWRTDGSAAGTDLVRDIAPGRASSRPSGLAAAGSLLYFAAGEDEHGIELWRSDGTSEGTWMAEDIAPGGLSSSPEELTVAGSRLFFSADDGITGRELWTYSLAAGPTVCQPSAEALCLNAGRFRVEIAWRDFTGQAGKGKAVPLTSDSGYFWFFNEANVEVILKVLDGRGVNGHHWVFYGALSSVEYTITVTDSQTGTIRQYSNPSGRLASVADTKAFATGKAGAASATKPAAGTAVRAPAAASGCTATATRLCLNGGRFAVEASWRDFQGNEGVGKALPLAGDTGSFWFFNQENVEVVLKVLDGRPVNGKFWVFYGALSSVEYTLTVTDTKTGAVKVYENPSGLLASVADTSAF